ncbi:MAG: DUF2909 domain-containing protein [Ideonella sp.]|nr:DUF2909 domain-containing protein [Ideonella sp.]
MKVAIVVMFVLIVLALAAAGRAMLRGGRDGGARQGAMMRALVWRIGLSVLLFVCLIAAYRLGWIRPTGVPLGG